MVTEHFRDTLERMISLSLKEGVDYADVRFRDLKTNTFTAENGKLTKPECSEEKFVSLRVIVDGRVGFCYTSSTNIDLKEFVKKAIKNACVQTKNSDIKDLSSEKSYRCEIGLKVKRKPEEVDLEEKVNLLLDVNENSSIDGISYYRTSLSDMEERKVFMNSEGSEVSVYTYMVGILQMSVAKFEENYEKFFSFRSKCKGYEYFKGFDAAEFAEGVSKKAVEMVKARKGPAGKFPVVADPKLVGLVLHEAAGHASEGDLVMKGESIFSGRINERIGSELVNIVDEGVVDGGYFVPFDDEGIPKGRTVIVEGGILKNYLTSRDVAHKLGLEPTGNGRADGPYSLPIVRQTNYYMEPGGFKLEELIEDIKYGLYVSGEGSVGGQVDVAQGTFTFHAGSAYLIKNGELGEAVKGVAISGQIFEVLKGVDGVGRDLEVTTSIFGACGKNGQRVKVGDGGPHVRIRKVIVGGMSTSPR
ncbi:MAG: TldD/PmbA family protein [Candidatus Asgardarchaeia archaeon]